jgi:NADP-dependent 3-hydroxy acid dehydrogenase YdfG
MSTLQDKIVLVVGGSSGIGLGIGKAFAREGSTVILAGRNLAKLEAAAAEFETAGPPVIRVCDAGNADHARGLVASVEQEFGRIDIMIYCAGINAPQREFTNATPEIFDEIMRVNANGAFYCFHAALPGMRARKDGLIINVVSIAGFRAFEFSGVSYCASKFAQSAIGVFARNEVLPEGVRVTNLYPGETDTPIMEKRPVPPPPEKRAQMLQPEDIADMTVAIARLPRRAIVPEIVITPSYQTFL